MLIVLKILSLYVQSTVFHGQIMPSYPSLVRFLVRSLNPKKWWSDWNLKVQPILIYSKHVWTVHPQKSESQNIQRNLKHINSISMWDCLLIKKICFYNPTISISIQSVPEFKIPWRITLVNSVMGCCVLVRTPRDAKPETPQKVVDFKAQK